MIGSLLRAYYGAASQSLLEDFSQFNLSTTVHEKMQAPALPLMVDQRQKSEYPTTLLSLITHLIYTHGKTYPECTYHPRRSCPQS